MSYTRHKKRLTILGSTGTIGKQCLEVVRAFPNSFEIIGLACYTQIDCLNKQAEHFKPQAIYCKKGGFSETLAHKPQVCLDGEDGLLKLLDFETDMLVVAIQGSYAIKAVQKACQLGLNIAIASKEVLVSAGQFLMPLAQKHHAHFFPVDSEHAALHQLMAAVNTESIKHLTLTASGGPFWQRDIKSFNSITPQQALKHPNWSMGNKITIDSANMLNKGFEIIEAHHLFNLDYSKLKAIIHPQSIIHACLETCDGSVLCHMGPADMRYPIQYALFEFKRLEKTWRPFSLNQLTNLSFFDIDLKRFPLFELAIECGKQGKSAPAALIAANDVAVELFLKEKLSFTGLSKCLIQTVEKFKNQSVHSIDDVLQIDHDVKQYVRKKY